MDYVRITSSEDPLFVKMHELMKEVFPPEEVLEFELWKEPLEDPSIRVFVAVHNGDVVGSTEYRYYPNWNIAMTDFTIIGRQGLSLGRFLAQNRLRDLSALAKENEKELFGMFAEIYDPYQRGDFEFGGVKAMDPFVRREVLSHLGYKKLNFTYVHPSWKNDGEAVAGLDLCFMPLDDQLEEISSNLVVDFITTYYSVLSNKPAQWVQMVEDLKTRETIELLPL
ncbi:GNAT family N-acetyltransferase [Robertmurraya korlensis]|uniref:GNAT family N-acetyltransferase n=1 Tax=Robertmurraya korlensis TaxID=519977 RepID=UPI002041246E|nr:GNAT family N-acetyltransferase [Robertmurraya korlensis]MCM3601472.1 GNAT family N-acetyltransferase [Robertmurraya korlensis]